jgi:hypothetical protein
MDVLSQAEKQDFQAVGPRQAGSVVYGFYEICHFAFTQMRKNDVC